MRTSGGSKVMEQQETALRQICYNPDNGRSLALTASAELMIKSGDDGWRPVDFCKNYAGYYPEVRFQAIVCKAGIFYGAGTDGEGFPHLFASVMGSVWDETLSGATALRPAPGQVVALLKEEEQNQLYMVLSSGQVITVPDCPRCIRILQLRAEAVKEAFLEAGDLVLVTKNDEILRLPCVAARQYGASVAYLHKVFAAEGGWLMDFRDSDHPLGARIEELIRQLPAMENCRYEHMEFQNYLSALEKVPKNKAVAFVCESGSRAAEAAIQVRKRGWRRAYYIRENEIGG
jgi:rhodanese-related sulfurtransferase